MKGLSIKRIAAIGLGAALVGSALAPVVSAANVVPTGLDELTVNKDKSIVIDTTGAPAVDVVVGANAAVSDVVWAGNIAARVAQLATISTGTGGAATVDVTVGGSTVVSGEGTDEDFAFVGGIASVNLEADDGDTTVLSDDSVEYKVDGDSQDDVDVTEILYTNPSNLTAYLQTDAEGVLAGQLVGNADENSFGYLVSFSSPIAEFDEDADVDISIPFLGGTWEIRDINVSSTPETVTLRSNELSEKVYVNDSITVNGIGEYEGKELQLTLTGVSRSAADADYEAEFELTDGETVLETITEVTDNDDLQTEIEDYTDSELTVDVVREDIDLGKGYVRINTGDQLLSLTEGEELDEDGNDDAIKWEVEIIDNGSGDLSAIRIFNSDDYKYLVSDAADDDLEGEEENAYKMGPMAVGSVVDIADRGLYKFQLVGLTTEDMFLNSLGDGKLGLNLSNQVEDIPFLLGPFSEGDEVNETIAGTDFTFYMSEDGNELRVWETADVSTDPQDEVGDQEYNLNAAAVADDFNDDVIVSFAADDETVTYNIVGFWDANRVDYYLALAANNVLSADDTDSAVTLLGTYADKDANDDVIVPYYLPGSGELQTDIFDNWVAANNINTLEDSDEDLYVAVFNIVDGNSAVDMNAYIDTSSGNLIDTSDDYAFIANSTPQVLIDEAAADIELDFGEEDELHMAGTDWGTEVSVEDNVLVWNVPDTAREVTAFLGSFESESTVEGGTAFTGLASGASDTKNNVKVTVNKINGSTDGVTVVAVGDLVKTSSNMGKSIIVGGWLANAAAKNLQVVDGQELESLLVNSGDYVAAVTPSGSIVVAGMTAADTGAAASELIDALEGLM